MWIVSLSFPLLLISLVNCDPCPPGYSQGGYGGDCFQIKTFYDVFASRYMPKTFDEAEAACNSDGGGLLASFHSEQDYDATEGLFCDRSWINIGLKCTGNDCKWDDGTPFDFEKLEETIDCTEGEREYKGGCASVHTTPLDSHSAEVSCPRGGHLVSIHSSTENNFYKKFALDSGVSGTINIGGQFANGKFGWNDGTNFNVNQWANSFPNTIFGNCIQMLLDSEFGTQGQWTNIDCSAKQPYICFRDGSVVDPTSVPIHPKADAKCPSIQYFTESGTIFSPNYPLSIPGQQTCEYVLGTSDGTRANVKFPSYNCGPGTFLSLYDGLNANQPFATFSTDAPFPQDAYSATSNVLKIVFTSNGTAAPEGNGWEANFMGI